MNIICIWITKCKCHKVCGTTSILLLLDIALASRNLTDMYCTSFFVACMFRYCFHTPQLYAKQKYFKCTYLFIHPSSSSSDPFSFPIMLVGTYIFIITFFLFASLKICVSCMKVKCMHTLFSYQIIKLWLEHSRTSLADQ